jgi:hypothetical protein
MDLVEFVLAVERRFNLRISDEDAAQIATPRELIEYLSARLGGRNHPGPCLTQRAFHRLRQAFVARLGARREVVRPQTELAALVPQATRRQSWACLQAATCSGSWPELRRPAWLFWRLFGCSVAAAVAAFVGLHDLWGWGLAVLGALGVWILRGIVLARATVGCKTEFKAPYVVVGDLVRFLLASTPIEDEPFCWTRRQIASVVHALIVVELGVVEYTEDSRWGEDLGFE